MLSVASRPPTAAWLTRQRNLPPSRALSARCIGCHGRTVSRRYGYQIRVCRMVNWGLGVLDGPNPKKTGNGQPRGKRWSRVLSDTPTPRRNPPEALVSKWVGVVLSPKEKQPNNDQSQEREGISWFTSSHHVEYFFADLVQWLFDQSFPLFHQDISSGYLPLVRQHSFQAIQTLEQIPVFSRYFTLSFGQFNGPAH